MLRFQVPASMLEKYPVRVVGTRDHAELWVPAEELDSFNSALTGPIEVAEIWWPRVD